MREFLQNFVKTAKEHPVISFVLTVVPIVSLTVGFSTWMMRRESQKWQMIVAARDSEIQELLKKKTETTSGGSPLIDVKTQGDYSPAAGVVARDFNYNVQIEPPPKGPASEFTPEDNYKKALHYYRGDDGPSNFALAREHCEAAATSNYPPAITLQGMWYWKGDVYSQSTKEAERLWGQAMKAGDSNAPLLQARMYEEVFAGIRAAFAQENGMAQSLHWYIQAARMGNKVALREVTERKWPSGTVKALKSTFPDSASEYLRMIEESK